MMKKRDLRFLILLGCAAVLLLAHIALSEVGGGARHSDSSSTAWQFAYELSESPSKPVIAPFRKLFPKCIEKVAGAQGYSQCQFQNMGIAPSAEHCRKSPGSCHNVGKAIDVGKIKCGDKVMDPKIHHEFYNKLSECFLTDPELGGSGKFQAIVYAFPSQDIMKSVVPKGARFYQKDDHADHIHIQWDCHHNAPENYRSCGVEPPPSSGSSGSGMSDGAFGGGSSGSAMPSMPTGGMPGGGSAPSTSQPPANPAPANTAPPNPAPANPPPANNSLTNPSPAGSDTGKTAPASSTAPNSPATPTTPNGAASTETPDRARPKPPASGKESKIKAPSTLAPRERMRNSQ